MPDEPQIPCYVYCATVIHKSNAFGTVCYKKRLKNTCCH